MTSNRLTPVTNSPFDRGKDYGAILDNIRCNNKSDANNKLHYMEKIYYEICFGKRCCKEEIRNNDKSDASNGTCWMDKIYTEVNKDETIEVPSVGGRQPRVLGRQILCEILEPRVEEIFQLVHREIQKCGYEDLLASGVVITGGSTLLAGMPELAEEVMGLPVRRGMPRGIGGLVDVVKSPMYATGVGLVVYGAKHQDRRLFRIREENVYKKVKGRMREWLEEIF